MDLLNIMEMKHILFLCYRQIRKITSENTYLYTVSNNKGTASIEANNDGIIKL